MVIMLMRYMWSAIDSPLEGSVNSCQQSRVPDLLGDAFPPPSFSRSRLQTLDDVKERHRGIGDGFRRCSR